MEPAPLREMVSKIREVESSLGDGAKTDPREEEREMFDKGRRSLHARIRIPQGTRITAEMLTTKRPGLGIEPHFIETLLGRIARTDIEEDQWIT